LEERGERGKEGDKREKLVGCQERMAGEREVMELDWERKGEWRKILEGWNVMATQRE
jgi:hypothetical protein